MEPENASERKREKIYIQTTRFWGSMSIFGGVSFNKIPREVPHDSKLGEVAHGFC